MTLVRHTKKNVVRFLHDKVGSKVIAYTAIVRCIFGEEGLTYANDVEDFDDKVTTLLANLSSESSTSFVDYLKAKILPLLRDNLLAGYPTWTSNNVESINHVFKQAVNWRPHMLPELITKLH